MVAGVSDGSAVLLHLSRLAAHTRHLLAHPAVELLWGEPGHADATDAQTVARLTLDGTAQMVARAAPEYAHCKRCISADYRRPPCCVIFAISISSRSSLTMVDCGGTFAKYAI